MAQMNQKHFYLQAKDLSELLGLKEIELARFATKQKIAPILFSGRSYYLPSDVRKILLEKGFNFSKKVISFQMLKGGVAKTTSALNFGLRAHMYGAKVLFLDLDQQANLSFALGVDDLKAAVFIDILEGKKDINDCLIEVDQGLSLLPSNLNNSIIERNLLQSLKNLSKVVSNPLKALKQEFDLIIIDTAPALSALNTAVTCASDEVILPVGPDKFTLFGLQKHLADLSIIRREFECRFTERILFTRFDARESSSAAYLSDCLEKFGPLMMKSYVRNSSEIKNTIASQKTIFDGRGYGKEDYDLVTRELTGLWF